MTEPVAYVQIKDGKAYSVLRKGTPNDDYVPVYTAEQLHPRVKMTNSEFDEWKRLYEDTIELSLTAYRILKEILNSSGKYIELSKRVYQENDSMTISKKQAELAGLFIRYNPDNPEETIEIIPNMKWFVRSKEKEQGFYLFLSSNNEVQERWYHTTKKDNTEFALSFDTKDEAELWANPLTEAVQLPVEDD